MQFSSMLLYLATHFLATLATSTNSSHASSTGPCKLRSSWRKSLDPSWFTPTHDCLGLSKILEIVNRNHKFNFCAVDPDVVGAYINASLSALDSGNRPKPCEVRAWYYGNYGGKLKKPFCQNATEIAVRVHHAPKDPSPARTQPYLTVFHGARSSCRLKFKADLQAMGDPDLAGPGVLSSQIIGMALLFFFNLAALFRKKFPRATTLLKTIPHFYVTATVLSCAITTAALVTFWQRRARSNALQANFGYFNFYVNLMLALAPPLSVMSAVVLVMMPPSVRDKASNKKIKLWDQEKGRSGKLLRARVVVAMLYGFCIAVMWTIWADGVRDQQNPTRIVFGGGMNVRVSSFIYKHASTYIFLICVLMSALPAAGLAVLAMLWAWHWTDAKRRGRSVSALRDACRNVFCFFGIAQLSMVAYIRGQTVAQADGTTAETDWGFGQILVVFTWLPLLVSIGSEMASAYFCQRASQASVGQWIGLGWMKRPPA